MVFHLILICTFVTAAYAQAVASVCNLPNPWNRINDRDLTTVDAQAHNCGEACQNFTNAGILADRQTTYGSIPFVSDLYATSTAFNPATSKAGDLLKFEKYTNISGNWLLPGGSTSYFIQYVSRGYNNTLVPATGVVVLPYLFSDQGPFPLLAWAHGTIGVTSGCAASSSFNFYDYDTWKLPFYQGYAIFLPDYQGLGNNHTLHPYEASTLNSNDVYYGIYALKKALGDLVTDEWIALGHSQGGATAWAIAESELADQTPCGITLLGVVAISPALRVADLVRFGAKTGGSSYVANNYWMLEAFQTGAGYGLFSDALIERVELGKVIGGCLAAFALLPQDLLLNHGADYLWRNRSDAFISTYPPLLAFTSQYGAGNGKPPRVPISVVQGTDDHIVPTDVVRKAYNVTCAAGGYPVELNLIPDLDHGATLGGSSPVWLRWIADRFHGKPGALACKERLWVAVDSSNAFKPADQT